MTASQYISALSLNLYVNMLRQTWWNDSPSTTGSITAGYNFDMGRWKNLGVTLSRVKRITMRKTKVTILSSISRSAYRSIPIIDLTMTCVTATR